MMTTREVANIYIRLRREGWREEPSYDSGFTKEGTGEHQ